eukprot:6194093-Pleurochrysis_carterae.AAC.2
MDEDVSIAMCMCSSECSTWGSSLQKWQHYGAFCYNLEQPRPWTPYCLPYTQPLRITHAKQEGKYVYEDQAGGLLLSDNLLGLTKPLTRRVPEIIANITISPIGTEAAEQY